MKKETKNKVISYSIIAAVGLLISFVFLRLRSFNAVTLPAERYRLLADAFTIPGIVFMMFGIVKASANSLYLSAGNVTALNDLSLKKTKEISRPTAAIILYEITLFFVSFFTY